MRASVKFRLDIGVDGDICMFGHRVNKQGEIDCEQQMAWPVL
tara:strand:+ start:8642 stop:8767 length:126 start_codon:yes stop_codon:yes gene_type:complete